MKNLRQQVSRLGLLVGLLVVMLCSCAWADDITYNIQISAKAEYQMAYDMMTAINNLRTSVGAGTLAYDEQLSRMATQRAAETSLYFSHTRPDETRWTTISTKANGENIAKGYSSTASAFSGWKNSSGHYANMVNKNFKSIGIGCVYRNYQYYWVQLFSTQAASSSSVPASADQTFTVKIADTTDNPFMLRMGNISASAGVYKDIALQTPYQLSVEKSWKGTILEFPASRFTWSSSSDAISVSQSGVMTANSLGSALIMAVPKDITGFAPSVTFTGKRSLDSQTTTISGIESTYYVTGSAINPVPTVSWNGTTLRSGTDYTVSYGTNTEYGTGTVTITGTGDYVGTMTSNFWITRITDLTDLTVQLPNNGKFTGSDRTFVWDNIKMYYQGKEVDKTNFSLSTVSSSDGQIEHFGVYMRGMFSGSKTFYCAGAFGTRYIPDQIYTGKALTPWVSVYRNKRDVESVYVQPLKEGTDYTATYSNNVNVGTATITIQGKGEYFGTATATFVIKKQAASTSSGSSTGGSTSSSSSTPASGSSTVKGTITAKKPAALKAVEKLVTTASNDKDVKGSSFAPLQAKVEAKSSTSLKVSWKKVSSAKKYVVYGSLCGNGKKYKKLKTTTGTSYTWKKLKKGKYYKLIVVAVNSKNGVIAESKTVHGATKGGSVGNTKKVTVKKSSVTIKKGKSYTIKATATAESRKLKVKKHRGLAYESTKTSVAKVSQKGVIKGVAKGTCYIYVYAQNGVCCKVKVKVK